MGYDTIKEFATATFVEKKSEFISYITPIKNEEEAKSFVQQISKQNNDATHNVFAYLLREGDISRCSDNGEPQGTAGVPTLDVIRKENITDVCIVTTRYFGGILLGGGGLVRAYGTAATNAVAAATRVTMKVVKKLSISCDYQFYQKLTHLMKDFTTINDDVLYAEDITLSFYLLDNEFELFTKKLTALSNGQITPKVLGEEYKNL